MKRDNTHGRIALSEQQVGALISDMGLRGQRARAASKPTLRDRLRRRRAERLYGPGHSVRV